MMFRVILKNNSWLFKYSLCRWNGSSTKTICKDVWVLPTLIDYSKLLEGINEGNTTDPKLLEMAMAVRQVQTNEKQLESDKLNILAEMQTVKDEDLKKKLTEQGRELRSLRRTCDKQMQHLENRICTFMLTKCNLFHDSTEVENRELVEVFEKPSQSDTIKMASHVELGSRCEQLEFLDVSPMAYYLRGQLALMELALGDFFSAALTQRGFDWQSNPDCVRTVIVEGCGWNNRWAMKSSQSTANNVNIQHLVGGASVESFSAFYAKHIIQNTESLPQRMFCVGRNYTPWDRVDYVNSPKPGLFMSYQSTCCDAFIVALSKTDQNHQFTELNQMLVDTYSTLGLHFRLVQLGIRHLFCHESAAASLQMFSPHSQEYHEIGRVSLCGDYIGRRLLALHQLSPNKVSFCSFFHVRVSNITRLLAIIMENTQTTTNGCNNYSVPDALMPFMLKSDT